MAKRKRSGLKKAPTNSGKRRMRGKGMLDSMIKSDSAPLAMLGMLGKAGKFALDVANPYRRF